MTSSSVVTLLVVAAAALALGIAVIAFLALRDPAATRRRIEAAFRRPAPPPGTPDHEHYYRPYWSR
jgi:hypothetical protein